MSLPDGIMGVLELFHFQLGIWIGDEKVNILESS
jgi:hypothetical protein